MSTQSTSPPTARPRRFTRSPPVGDLIVATVAFGLTVALLAGRGNATRGLDPLGAALAAVACFPLLARRSVPLAVFALTTAASATLNALGYAEGPPFGPTLALLFVAGDERTPARLRQTAAVVLGLFAIHIGATAAGHDGFPAVPVLSGIVVWGGAWIIGDQLRQRRHRRFDLAERARRAEHEMVRERRLAAAEERTRIARDLHDSAAHAINVILVQAGAARLLQQRDPDAVASALTTIEAVARETIGEIDQLIRGLRAEEHAREPGNAVEPPIGLEALDMLAERHRAAGNRVEIRLHGQVRPLAPGLNQAAYRILQESLTNAARHGSGTSEVDVRYGPDQLELTVANPMLAHADGDATQSGHGILGMRERAALLAGTLETQARGGRFRVHARFPYLSSREA